MKLLIASTVVLAIGAGTITLAAPPKGPDFNREVRPILSHRCFKCHGPDEGQRQAKLRLDQREGALRGGASGKPAVVPGKPAASELVRRVLTHDGLAMPPVRANNPLTDAEKEVLRRWVAAGAPYAPHWAFVPPKAAPLPRVKNRAWVKNPIDAFVLARLEAAGLQPSPPADRYTLVRRVYLDLIGLPPTPEEADAFVNDRSPDAYEKLVDRLLASPHYGERWARRWLDLARYADTNGYEKDRPRSIWPYRDWVINALNRDMPYDRFTIEQLAGDMLPNATLEQKIATGFHRNTMLNEEGGIDPLEFRFYAMTDRVFTTGTTWLGLTVGCAQCHTHKFDPITQREYYQFMACLDNADEPEMEIPRPEIAAKRKEIEAKIAAIEQDLPNRFPPGDELRWSTPKPERVLTSSGAAATVLPDNSIRVSGTNPAADSYQVTVETDLPDVAAVRVEALTDPSLGNGGPGRTPHGNFVLSEITGSIATEPETPLKFSGARADFSQDGFPASHAIDGNPKTGWAIAGPGTWNVNRSAVFTLEKLLHLPRGSRWTFRLEQQHGSQHTLGRFRISLGAPVRDSRPLQARRRENLERKYQEWLGRESERAVRWTVLRPAGMKTDLALLTLLDDNSVLASGDMTKRDVYDLTYRTDLKGITAVRLEVLPDDSLPKHGPGRVYYEGAPGDFFLSEATLAANGAPAPLARASQTFAGGAGAAAAIDGDPQTGWSINGGQGRAHAAVFNLAQPTAAAGELSLRLLFERYHAAALGRFRVSATTDPRAEARLPADVEEDLLVPAAGRTAGQKERLLRYFLSVAPELAPAREEVQAMRAQMPAYPTTLVFSERPGGNPRPTYVHRRGEFLQPAERVEAGVPAVLNPLPEGAPHNRLAFARWLVDPKNPLTARVAVNRQWAAFFGQGIVRTQQDFGYQGEPPTHPELLDWLAVAFSSVDGEKGRGRDGEHPGTRLSPPLLPSLSPSVRLAVASSSVDGGTRLSPPLLPSLSPSVRLAVGTRLSPPLRPSLSPSARLAVASSSVDGGTHLSPPLRPSLSPSVRDYACGWSLKKLHRLIVTSAAYQQSSRVTPELLAKDPLNQLLSRGPRVRLEAELIRDSALKASGLLSGKIGGPSVFPPQPPGVTSEGTYGPLVWKVSEGEDRYRRGLYTFTKRTAPYAMTLAFDGPSGEACVARREVSNSPLQALTLLNDQVFVETSQALGRMIAARPGTVEERAAYLFRRCLTRPPAAEELGKLVRFYQAQKERLEKKELDAAKIAGPGEGDANERAAWTTLARSVLNLDEAIVKP